MEKYDVFISCKSEDYKYAEEVYDFLKDNGIQPFLASKELRLVGESEYRKIISEAIKNATHLIVFASDAKYIDSTWVYYEWDMFLHAKLKGYKTGNLITVLKGVSPNEISMDLWKYESFSFDGYKEDILKYVETEQSRLRLKIEKKIDFSEMSILELKILFDDGNLEAAYQLGNCYFYGKGCVENYFLAVKYYRFAADNGHPDAQYCLGMSYYNGTGVLDDLTLAIKYLTMSAEQGVAKAEYVLGNCYYRGIGVEINYDIAVKYYESAAIKGMADAQNDLAVCYENGRGVVRDRCKAIEYYEQAANQGHAMSQHALGIYYSEFPSSRDWDKAIHYFKLAAEQGYADAQYQLASLYFEGKVICISSTVAFKYLKESADQGKACAQYLMAQCYADGKDGQIDINKAMYYYKLAAEQGWEVAKNAIKYLQNEMEREC